MKVKALGMKQRLLLLLILFSINITFAQYDWTKADIYLKNKSSLKGEALLTVGSFGGKESWQKNTFKIKTGKIHSN